MIPLGTYTKPSRTAGFADVTTYRAGGELVVQGRWTGATQAVSLPAELRDVVEVTA